MFTLAGWMWVLPECHCFQAKQKVSPKSQNICTDVLICQVISRFQWCVRNWTHLLNICIVKVKLKWKKWITITYFLCGSREEFLLFQMMNSRPVKAKLTCWKCWFKFNDTIFADNQSSCPMQIQKTAYIYMFEARKNWTGATFCFFYLESAMLAPVTVSH